MFKVVKCFLLYIPHTFLLLSDFSVSKLQKFRRRNQNFHTSKLSWKSSSFKTDVNSFLPMMMVLLEMKSNSRRELKQPCITKQKQCDVSKSKSPDVSCNCDVILKCHEFDRRILRDSFVFGRDRTSKHKGPVLSVRVVNNR